jgi:hypothetical protein
MKSYATSIQQVDQENQSANVVTPCPACGCSRLNIILEKPPNPHYAAARCGGCDCFRFWIENPKTTAKREEWRRSIERLLKSGDLSDWEREFLIKLQTEKKPSPKQLQTLNRISAERGGAA